MRRNAHWHYAYESVLYARDIRFCKEGSGYYSLAMPCAQRTSYSTGRQCVSNEELTLEHAYTGWFARYTCPARHDGSPTYAITDIRRDKARALRQGLRCSASRHSRLW